MRYVLGWCAVLLMSGAARPAADPQRPTSTPFHLLEHGGLVVEGRLNGRGPYRLLLDTGSTHSSISPRAAREVGAPAVARANVDSSIGASVQPVMRLERLDVGPIGVRDLLPTLVAPETVGLSSAIDGVIGQDVLAPLCYTIDFRRRRVDWAADTTERADPAASLPLEADHGRFLVVLRNGSSQLRLVPDSGASGLLLVRDPDRALPPLTLMAGTAELSTLSARGAVQRAIVHELRVGRTRLRDLPAVLVAPRQNALSVSDGLLPLHLFDRVTFDGPRRLLIVEGGGV